MDLLRSCEHGGPAECVGRFCSGTRPVTDADLASLGYVKLDGIRSAIFSTLVNFYGMDESDPEEQEQASDFTDAVLAALDQEDPDA